MNSKFISSRANNSFWKMKNGKGLVEASTVEPRFVIPKHSTLKNKRGHVEYKLFAVEEYSEAWYKDAAKRKRNDEITD